MRGRGERQRDRGRREEKMKICILLIEGFLLWKNLKFIRRLLAGQIEYNRGFYSSIMSN